ncbi:MAG TPA: hypothetical protein VKA92_15300, partial [Segetibacter sp.]|nr:hypothetical protein [Segetibacter sp.]
PFGRNGLTDYYIKARYKASDKFLLTADLHQFSSAVKIANNDKKSLGQELDIVGNYSITKQISVEGGLSHFFSTSLLTSPDVKNVPNARTNANWAYVMINIKPEFLLSK